MIRFFDILFSLLGLLLLSPLFVVLALLIVLESKGGVFYRQSRVGKDGREFRIFKFRSMRTGSDAKGLLTVGENDRRITKVGHFIRRYKLDELAQLINVLLGDMSLVGPRPEVKKYVQLYTPEQRKVLEVKPGITDYASIEYRNENEILAQSENPEKTYIEEIMPHKIELNMRYIKHPGLLAYFKILGLTVRRVFLG